MEKVISKTEGLTLIELLVVISIIGILSVLAVPPFIELLSKWRVEGDASKLYERLKFAQTEAEKQGDVTIFSGNIAKRRIFVSIEPLDGKWQFAVWRWQDSNGNNIPEANEFDKEFETINPVDEPIAREDLTNTKIGFDKSVDKKACDNTSGVPSGGIVNLIDCPNVICPGCKCIRFNGKGFIEGLNGGTVYVTNDKFTVAVNIGVAGLLKMCRWNGSQWIDMQ